MQTELPIPAAARATESSTELVRIWRVHDTITCSYETSERDPRKWGEMLAHGALAIADDLANHHDAAAKADIILAMRERLELGTGSYDVNMHTQKLRNYDKVVDMYHSESDRAAAVLAGAFIDDFLTHTLRDFLADSDATNQLFSKYGPLATFAAKIDLACALGLISSGVRRDLNYVRKIRNHFAHQSDVVSFGSSPVREWCAQLSMAAEFASYSGRMKQIAEDPRIQYLLSIGVAAARMGAVIQSQRKRTIPA